MSGAAAVVTGASKGIGRAITAALVAEGAHAVAGARTRTDAISEGNHRLARRDHRAPVRADRLTRVSVAHVC